MAITADAIGQGWPVLVAPSMNAGLWTHPRSRSSIEALCSWGVTVIEPDLAAGVPRLAPAERLLDAVRARLSTA